MEPGSEPNDGSVAIGYGSAWLTVKVLETCRQRPVAREWMKVITSIRDEQLPLGPRRDSRSRRTITRATAAAGPRFDGKTWSRSAGHVRRPAEGEEDQARAKMKVGRQAGLLCALRIDGSAFPRQLPCSADRSARGRKPCRNSVSPLVATIGLAAISGASAETGITATEIKIGQTMPCQRASVGL